jgi:hypothetical protein
MCRDADGRGWEQGVEDQSGIFTIGEENKTGFYKKSLPPAPRGMAYETGAMLHPDEDASYIGAVPVGES